MSPATLGSLVLALIVVVVVAQLLGRLATRVGQPAVIGEILAGVLLGPTLFGGAVTHALFPAAITPALGVLSDVGVAVFMFLVGLEFDRATLRGQGRLTVGVGLGAIAVPFALGVLLAATALARYTGPDRTAFVLFLGVAMAITAFPVLARILADRGLLTTPVGGLALACASVGDVLAWVMLAVVATLAGAAAQPWLVLLIIPWAALLLLVVRPVLDRLAARPPRSAGRAPTPLAGAAVLGAVAAGLWLSASATSAMGLHLIFGAFLFGVAMPRVGVPALRERVLPWVHRISSVLLLPVFFVVSGLAVDLSGLDGGAWADLLLIMLVAVGGKWVGVAAGARTNGLGVRRSAVLAVLLNTRGLTELVVLAVGLQRGLLTAELYSLMVVMALVTTAMTGVILPLVYPRGQRAADLAGRGQPPASAGPVR